MPSNLPAAHLAEEALRIKLLLDHREDLVKARSEDQQRLRWHLHDLWPELELPAGCLDRIAVIQGRIYPPAREFLARSKRRASRGWKRCVA